MRFATELALHEIREAIGARRVQCDRLSAQAFLRDVRQAVERLGHYPGSWASRPDLTTHPVRFCLVQTHWIVYTPEPFQVARFLYAGREIMALPG